MGEAIAVPESILHTHVSEVQVCRLSAIEFVQVHRPLNTRGQDKALPSSGLMSFDTFMACVRFQVMHSHPLTSSALSILA